MGLPLAQYTHDLYRSITKRGLFSTLSLLLPEVLFDWRYGTDTFKLVSNDDLHKDLKEVSPESKASGGAYQGANPKLFYDVFHWIRLQACPDFSKETFLDYGCGKGRTLLMAAELKFQRAVGVDYSLPLCETARKNVEIYKSKRPDRLTDFEVVHSDALVHDVPTDATFFFFFNPFQAQILKPVLERVVKSCREHPRRAFAIYMNPQHPECFSPESFEKLEVFGDRETTPDSIVYRIKA